MDLNDFLTEAEIRHYERFLGVGRVTTFVHPDADQPWRWSATTAPADNPAPRQRAAIAAAERLESWEDEMLLKHGWGPDQCSASQELVPSPLISWDVCGYYRRLGVPWTATRKQIREALHRHGATLGGGNAALIYAASQLLDEAIRREYDRVPLGGLFLKDKDTEDRLKRAAHAAASAQAARGRPEVTPEDVLGDWGFSVGPRGGPNGEGREGQASAAPPPPPPGPPLGRLTSFWELSWSWYAEPGQLLNRRTEALEAWQQLLIQAFAAAGVRTRFAVGLCGAETFSVRPAPDQQTVVILLGKGDPSPEKATQAVEAWGLAAET